MSDRAKRISELVVEIAGLCGGRVGSRLANLQLGRGGGLGGFHQGVEDLKSETEMIEACRAELEKLLAELESRP